MTPEELGASYPYVYHMSEEGSWPSIARHGLLSTTALLDLFEVEQQERQAVEHAHRPESVRIHHPDYGSVVIRDQKPLNPSKLRGCLQNGLTEVMWYEILNRRVFFWAVRGRLERLLAARAYRPHRHTVLTVDSESLARDYEKEMWITTMNTGTTSPMAHPRGAESFVRLRDFDLAASRRKRGRGRAIVEIAVEYGVPNIAEYVVRVEHTTNDREPEVVFERLA